MQSKQHVTTSISSSDGVKVRAEEEGDNESALQRGTVRDLRRQVGLKECLYDAEKAFIVESRTETRDNEALN